jgi:TolA-binding protein
MKSFRVIVFFALAALMAALLFSACAKMEGPKSMTPTATMTGKPMTDRDQYVKDVQAQIDDYAMKIEDLKKKAEALTGSAKDEMNQKIEALTAKQEEAKGKLDELKMASEKDWDKAKGELDVILADLDNLYKDAAKGIM